jgi:hypothetical protein
MDTIHYIRLAVPEAVSITVSEYHAVPAYINYTTMKCDPAPPNATYPLKNRYVSINLPVYKTHDGTMISFFRCFLRTRYVGSIWPSTRQWRWFARPSPKVR